MDDEVVKGMIMGATYQLALIELAGYSSKREFVRLTPREIFGYGAMGAIGGGLGAIVAGYMWPNNNLLYHVAIILGMITYDHFLLG
jgi:hypothetical protein